MAFGSWIKKINMPSLKEIVKSNESFKEFDEINKRLEERQLEQQRKNLPKGIGPK